MSGIDPAIVEAFWQARQHGAFYPPEWFGKLTMDQGYQLLFAISDRRVASGEKQIGWKVGLTAKAIQQQFGFHEPVFGCVFETKPSGYAFAPGELIVPGFENELCMRLRSDLSGPIGIDQARDAIDVIYPAMEIIETRGPLAEQIALALADNAQQKTNILGAPVPLPADPAAIDVSVSINGEPVATGRGAAVLDNPLNSIVWLAGKLPAFGRKLRAGDIVMTGSFTRQFPLKPGDRVETNFSGVGTVTVSMTS